MTGKIKLQHKLKAETGTFRRIHLTAYILLLIMMIRSGTYLIKKQIKIHYTHSKTIEYKKYRLKTIISV